MANYITVKAIRKNLLMLLTAILLSGCGLTLPPITDTPTDTFFPGRFVWVDLVTNDVPAVKKFYYDIFAWEFEGSESGYTIITHHDMTVGGILHSRQLKEDINQSRWTGYMSVANVEYAVEIVRQRGGKVIREPFDLDDRGRAALVADPQGAVFILIRSSTGDPEFIKPRLGEWLWIELVTNAADSAASFYTNLTGLPLETKVNENNRKYHFLTANGKNIAGIVQAPWENVQPNWIPYVRVEDPKVVVERVKKIGGRVIMEPHKDIRMGTVAVIADPTGGVIAVQKWPLN